MPQSAQLTPVFATETGVLISADKIIEVEGNGGGTFFEVRPEGYSGAPAEGANLVLLNSGGSSIQMNPGMNFIAVKIGNSSCILTLLHPPTGAAASYEVMADVGSTFTVELN